MREGWWRAAAGLLARLAASCCAAHREISMQRTAVPHTPELPAAAAAGCTKRSTSAISTAFTAASPSPRRRLSRDAAATPLHHPPARLTLSRRICCTAPRRRARLAALESGRPPCCCAARTAPPAARLRPRAAASCCAAEPPALPARGLLAGARPPRAGLVTRRSTPRGAAAAALEGWLRWRAMRASKDRSMRCERKVPLRRVRLIAFCQLRRQCGHLL